MRRQMYLKNIHYLNLSIVASPPSDVPQVCVMPDRIRWAMWVTFAVDLYAALGAIPA